MRAQRRRAPTVRICPRIMRGCLPAVKCPRRGLTVHHKPSNGLRIAISAPMPPLLEVTASRGQIIPRAKKRRGNTLKRLLYTKGIECAHIRVHRHPEGVPARTRVHTHTRAGVRCAWAGAPRGGRGAPRMRGGALRGGRHTRGRAARARAYARRGRQARAGRRVQAGAPRTRAQAHAARAYTRGHAQRGGAHAARTRAYAGLRGHTRAYAGLRADAGVHTRARIHAHAPYRTRDAHTHARIMRGRTRAHTRAVPCLSAYGLFWAFFCGFCNIHTHSRIMHAHDARLTMRGKRPRSMMNY